jgi:chitinase
MKKFSFLFLLLFICLFSCSHSKNQKNDLTASSDSLSKTPIVLAYVTANSDIMPDPNYVTHINYAFGHVSDSFNSIVIQHEDRLREIVNLKKEHPNLKILLSIGGWTSGGFSEMASDTLTRKGFVLDCKRVVEQFNLDGVDLDWEYPTSSAAGISSSPNDMDNFTLLMKEIREVLGTEKLLTLASAYTAQYYDFNAIDKYIDFVNIMTYDMGRPPYHNAPLGRSEHTRNLSVEESVDAHVLAGVPLNKLTLGLAFYGHGIKGINDFVDYKDIPSLKGYTQKWDTLAQVPYLVDSDGVFVYSFDNPESLRLKCEYLLKKGLLGAMYWEYSCDDADGTLRKTVYNTVMNK